MIPIRLQMCNFLSYGVNVPPLDFTQFSIACLSGKNGQGKSALLEAITWAIWGEGRKESQEKKPDNGLLKVGENQMWVDLTIDLEGEHYRIIRKFSKTKNKNRSELELQVFNEDHSSLVSLSSPSIYKTQQRINRLLRMDYDTFINSAFILQGRVDEFTRKSARERKQILSDVLGLAHYESLSVLARQHVRKLEGEILTLDSRLMQMDHDIHQKKSFQEDFQTIQREEKVEGLRIEEVNENLQKLEKNLHQCHYEQERGKEIASQIQVEKKELQEYEKRKKRMKQNILDYESVLSKKEEIEAAYNEYLALYHENQQMRLSMQQYRDLEKRKRQLENHIEKIRNQILLQIEQKKQHYFELKGKADSLSKQKSELKKLEFKMEQFKVLMKKQEQIQQEGSQFNIKIETINNQIKRLKDEIQKNREKMDLLNQGKQEVCPLCQSPLNQEKKLRIKLNTEKEIAKCQGEMNTLAEEVTILSNKRFLLQQVWKKIHYGLAKKENIQYDLNRKYLILQEVELAAERLIATQEEINNLENQLKNEKFAIAERIQFKEIENRMQKQGYSDQRYIEINQRLEDLREVPLQIEKLKVAQRMIVNFVKEQQEVDQQLLSKQSMIRKKEQDYDQIKGNRIELPELGRTIKVQKDLLDQLQQKQYLLYQKRGVIQEKLSKIEQYQKEKQKVEEQKNQFLYQKGLYDKLMTAFGKNGIQSIIIENTIPELEEEANEILSHLTDEKTTINIESLKDLKSGGVRETLDIKIHDELGIRPYELYSGGETFRIDFAIRIALSKLLTYRAGAKLRTLVIDEGFGTQDEEGLQKLIQAIHVIQSDFDKILVITHLSLLKDAFPVRIEVWKDPILGSQLELIHL